MRQEPGDLYEPVRQRAQLPGRALSAGYGPVDSLSRIIVAAAREAVGARFRLHGRDPATGLDCVGLAAWAFAAAGFRGIVPDGYAMRGGDPRTVGAMLDASGLVAVADGAAGDLLLCASGPGQLHLAIASDAGVIHADAMLRRVVERPGALPWPLLGRWRLGQSGD